MPVYAKIKHKNTTAICMISSFEARAKACQVDTEEPQTVQVLSLWPFRKINGHWTFTLNPWQEETTYKKGIMEQGGLSLVHFNGSKPITQIIDVPFEALATLHAKATKTGKIIDLTPEGQKKYRDSHEKAKNKGTLQTPYL